MPVPRPDKGDCRHCSRPVQMKAERVKLHLLNCNAFAKHIQAMSASDLEDIPEEYLALSTKRLQTQKVMGDSYSKLPPPITKEEQIEFDKSFARHYYSTGTSFYRSECPDLAEALNKVRPGLCAPSRKRIATTLLDEAYEETQKELTDMFKKTQAYSTLATDGWSDIRRSSIVNYIAANGSVAAFLEAQEASSESHTSEWLATEANKIFEKYDYIKWAGSVTDNASAPKGSWKILEKLHPDKFFYGCITHTLHLTEMVRM